MSGRLRRGVYPASAGPALPRSATPTALGHWASVPHPSSPPSPLPLFSLTPTPPMGAAPPLARPLLLKAPLSAPPTE